MKVSTLQTILVKSVFIYWPLLFLFVLFSPLRVPFLTKEFTFEETTIVKSATAISQTGHPTIYLGESSPQIINLWKPPGLVFFMAVSFKLFGVSELSARAI